jgi:hypothetical protein
MPCQPAASGGLEGPQTSPQGPICPHLAMQRRPTIVPKGNQVASGRRSSATCYGLRPTCHPFTRHLRPARIATPTRLGKCPRKGLQRPYKTRPGTGRFRRWIWRRFTGANWQPFQGAFRAPILMAKKCVAASAATFPPLTPQFLPRCDAFGAAREPNGTSAFHAVGGLAPNANSNSSTS